MMLLRRRHPASAVTGRAVMANPLIFFDINGTLILRDQRTDIPFSRAVDEFLGVSGAMRGVDTSARSDKDVFIEVLSRHGAGFSPESWARFLGLYTAELEAFSGTDVWRENDEAVRFVKALHRRDYILALITGELGIGAEFKLKKLGIWDCFLAGGYGEDGLRRFDIAERALSKVRDLLKRDFGSMYVIGDTVLDVETARHLGAVSIAITTGSHPREKLLASNPDYCVDRFRDLESLFFP